MKNSFVPVGGAFHIEPAYVADVGNGYVQACRGAHYTAEVKSTSTTANEKLYFVLSNPYSSRVNIFLNETIIANLSACNLVANMYYCVRAFEGSALQKARAVPTNLGRCQNAHCGCFDSACCGAPCCENHGCCGCNGGWCGSLACVTYGTNMTLADGTIGETITIPAYETWAQKHGGSVLIAPGCTFVIELAPLSGTATMPCAITAQWWEEPLL
jgi:hypothetical protein